MLEKRYSIIWTLCIVLISTLLSCKITINAANTDTKELTGTFTYHSISAKVDTEITLTNAAAPKINTLGQTVDYTVGSKALPDGLEVDKTTGKIYGTPKAVTASTVYTITATGTEEGYVGSIKTADITIAITAADIKELTGTFTYDSISTIVGTEITLANAAAPKTNSLGQAVNYTIGSKTLPDGLKVDKITGKIYGTPKAVTASAVYTIIATGTEEGYAGSIKTADITIEVAAAELTGTFTYTNISAEVGTEILIADAVEPKTNPAEAVTYSIGSKTLPEGLEIDKATGKIYGTPKAVIASAVYTIIATGTEEGYIGSTMTANVTIVVVTQAISYSSVAQGTNHTVTPVFADSNLDTNNIQDYAIKASNTSDDATTPILPEIDSKNGTITVKTNTSAGTYTVTFNTIPNSGYVGSKKTDFRLTKNPTTISELEALLKTGIRNFGLNADYNYIKTNSMTSMIGVFSPNYVDGVVTEDTDEKSYIKDFNGDISTWNVANVTDMNHMFNDATKFTGDISTWNVGKVTDMNNMFRNALRFSSDIGSWNVANVTNMSEMFAYAYAFNQDIGKWETGKVSNMFKMFFSAEIFNRDLDEWDVSKVTNMRAMFYDAREFNGAIGKWQVNNVKDMSAMFNRAYAFNQDISSWTVSNVTNMVEMFSGAIRFNADISAWDVKNVTNMSYMFLTTEKFNADISNWNVAKVTNMSYMFFSTDVFNIDISSWDVAKVTNMNSMFEFAGKFTQNLDNWNVAPAVTKKNMFKDSPLKDTVPCWYDTTDTNDCSTS